MPWLTPERPLGIVHLQSGQIDSSGRPILSYSQKPLKGFPKIRLLKVCPEPITRLLTLQTV
jgi:hypothetical protein